MQTPPSKRKSRSLSSLISHLLTVVAVSTIFVVPGAHAQKGNETLANDDPVTVQEDASTTFLDVLANDTGNGISISNIGVPNQGGTAVSNGGFAIDYTPLPNFFGEETFTYTIVNLFGDDSTGTVIVTVNPVNDKPVGRADEFTVAEDSNVNLLLVLDNDFDQEGDDLFIADIETEQQHGVLNIIADDKILVYTPTKDYFGPDSFVYVLSDGRGGTDLVTVDLTIDPVNDPPLARSDALEADEDVPTPLNVLQNDSILPDVDEQLFVHEVSQGSQGGTVTIAADALSVTYTSASDFFGEETFSYTIRDEGGLFSAAEVTLTVHNTNDPPTAVPDNDSVVAEDSSGNLLDVMGNDTSDPDPPETLSVTAAGNTSDGGVVQVAVGNKISYTPAPNFFGNETFEYTLMDENGGESTGTVVVEVTPVNDPPLARDDNFTVTGGTVNNVLNVLGNDSTQPDTNELLRVISVGAGSQGGSIGIGANAASVLYTPRQGFAGVEIFTYTLNDGTPDSNDQATVSVDVRIAPTAKDDFFSVNEDSNSNSFNVLANDDFAPGAQISIFAIGATSAGGNVAVVSGASLRYSPAPDFFGTETFTYTMTDGSPTGRSTARVTVTVQSQNDNPTARDDIFNVPEDSTNQVLPVLDNDTIQPDQGESLSIVSVTSPSAGGTAVITSSVIILYTPLPDFDGEETFNYTISDGNGGTDTATVTVRLSGTDDPPTATEDTFEVTEDSEDTFLDVLGNDLNPDPGEVLTVVDIGTPDNGGTIAISPSGDGILYTPAPDFFGVEVFTYTITDTALKGAAQGSVTVTVTNLPDDPTAINDVFTVTEDAALTLDVLANDSVAPDQGETLSITGVGTPDRGGSAVINAEGTAIEYSPPSEFSGIEQFTYTISDNNGGSAEALVLVTVDNQNDPPLSISLSSTMIAEGVPIGRTVGTFSTEDADTSDVHTYTLVDGEGSEGNGSFSIDADTLISNVIFDMAKQLEFSIRVRSDDNHGASVEEMFLISVVEADQDLCNVLEQITGQIDAFNAQFDVFILDLDNDGLPEEYALALMAWAACSMDGSDRWVATVNAFEINLMVLDGEAQILQLQNVRELVAALMSISSAAQGAVAGILAQNGIDLDGHYEAVICSGGCMPLRVFGKTLAEGYVAFTSAKGELEVYSGAGDFDDDGTNNLQEFLNVTGRGGSGDEFVRAATDPDSDGTKVDSGGCSAGSVPTAMSFGGLADMLYLIIAAGIILLAGYRQRRA